MIQNINIPVKNKKPGRNDLCPCGSKIKFKRCHGGINAIPTPKPGQIDAHLRNSTPKETCFAPIEFRPGCKGKIISSHTVSRSGSLGAIAKNGHVYSYAMTLQRIHAMNGRLEPRLTGWKEASTFPGFCAHHDKTLFAPLEDAPFTGSQQQCFLLAYRSIAWELYAKQRAAKTSPYRAVLAGSKGPEAQAIIAHFNQMNELSLLDAQAHKATYDDVLVGQRWSRCHGLLIEFDQIFPIQCSAAWSPTEDIHGNSIQTLGFTPRTPESAAIVSFAADGKSYFLITWLEDSASVASKIATSIHALPKEKIAGVVAALLLLTSENCHLSPSWFDGLPTIGKEWVHNLAHPLFYPKPTPSTAGSTTHIGSIGVISSRMF